MIVFGVLRDYDGVVANVMILECFAMKMQKINFIEGAEF